MVKTGSPIKGYVLAAGLGAIAGGIAVALATKAVPKMMSRMMAGMMQKMMSQMEADGGTPSEMCRRMMAACSEAQQQDKQRE
jgi:hypothetical protein